MCLNNEKCALEATKTMFEMGKNKKSWSILATCLVLISAMVGLSNLWACVGCGDSLPAEVNGGAFAPSSSEERNAQYAAQEQEEASFVEARAEANEETAEINESEFSQELQDNLEQPASLGNAKETLIYKTQFLISYNTARLCPNYVCWSLDANRAYGKVQRTNNFHGDPSMREEIRVEHFDYNGSGYDRGHMCPAGDNKNTAKAMDESFCMTNMCPQNHDLNTGAWNDLEMQCRSWAKNYGTLYICCGPIFDSDTPKAFGQRRNIRIAVPDRFFKVILTLGRVPKAIGFIYPNKPCNGDMRQYAVPVDRVEKETGIDFFHRLEDKLEKELERDCSPAAWGI